MKQVIEIKANGMVKVVDEKGNVMSIHRSRLDEWLNE